MAPDVDLSVSLVERAARGDAMAVAELLHRYEPRLVGYARKHMPADLAAVFEPQDVVQDTYFQAVRCIHTFKPEGTDALLRWLLTIARHSLTDLVRMQRAGKRNGYRLGREDSSVTSLLTRLPGSRRSPSQSAAAHELVALLERAIARLPEDYQRAVTLRHIDGLGVAETAQRMNRSPGAIHMLCARALQSLREDMESSSPPDGNPRAVRTR
jgi:RNA polymerase sigma-70 factor (ECF subfamily)